MTEERGAWGDGYGIKISRKDAKANREWTRIGNANGRETEDGSTADLRGWGETLGAFTNHG